MGAQQTNFITFTCDECSKSATFQMTKEERDKAVVQDPWIDTIRVIKRAGDGAEVLYCGDECEIKAAGAGKHNKPEEKKIITDAGNSASVQLAAKAAEAARAASARLKQGNAFESVR